MSINSFSNQHTKDPREIIFWELYLTDLAKGVQNAYDAAIRAGYSHDHARNITLQGWFKVKMANIKRKEMLPKAEKNLNKVLEMVTTNEEGKEDIDLLKVQIDVSKHVTRFLGKDEGWSERQEHTGANGSAITITFDKSFDQNDKNMPQV